MNDWPLLVVCPSTVVLTWLEILRDWLPSTLLPSQQNLIVITSGKARPCMILLQPC